MSVPVHPIHAGPRMTFPALTGTLAAIALSIVLTVAQFTGWLVLGGFLLTEIVVYQSFSVLVRRRRRELALLRCFGASRGQVFAGVLAEAAWVGLFGAAAGLGLGALVLDLYGFDVAVFVLITSVIATVIAALIPAYRASRVPPGGPRR
jgi:predicted lysophospholipase L1 biosynthesis ABC-type transport system permease subunit